MKYDPATCAAFLRTRDQYGALSNFSGGFPITVNDRVYRTSEALYQCARFPDYPDVQQEILDAKSPMTAKMISKKYKELTRPDWDLGYAYSFKVSVMKWVLDAKWFCNFEKFTEALVETEYLPIVEISKRDDFWGAKPQPDGTLIGDNILGLLLTTMRNRLYDWNTKGTSVEGFALEPVNKIDFKFFGKIPERIMLVLP